MVLLRAEGGLSPLVISFAAYQRTKVLNWPMRAWVKGPTFNSSVASALMLPARDRGHLGPASLRWGGDISAAYKLRRNSIKSASSRQGRRGTSSASISQLDRAFAFISRSASA